jgi:Na+/melibiose symporter-like transporter
MLAGLIIFSSAWFTRDQIPRLKPPPANPGKADLKALFAAMGHCLQNRNYRMLLIGLLCLSATIGVRETLSSYTGLFFWELKELQLRNFALSSPPAYILAFIFIARLHRKLDKRTTIIGSMVLVIFSVSTPMLFRLLDLLPANGSKLLMPVLLFYHFFFYLGFSTLTISVLSALADIADEHELNTGVRQEGMFYAARTFFGQLSSALGHLIGGVALDLIAFPKGAKPGDIPQDVLNWLALFEGPIAALPAVVAIAFYARFHISRKQLEAIQSELARRHAAAAESAPKSDSPTPKPTAPNEVFAGGA